MAIVVRCGNCDHDNQLESNDAFLCTDCGYFILKDGDEWKIPLGNRDDLPCEVI